MDPQRVVVHDSVGIVFDPSLLVEVLSDLPVTVEVGDDDTELDERDAVVAFGPSPSFEQASWVHCIRAGYDEFPIEQYADEGVVLTNSTGIHDTTVGETVVGYLLSFARRLHVYRDQQNRAEWEREPYEVPFTIAGETACVVGLGTLGTGVASRLDALGMDVVGVRRSGEPHDNARRVYTPDEIDTAVADARFVVLAVPLTDETANLVSTATLAAMPSNSYLVNVARGGVVDSEALLTALDEGEIAGAALDVFETEPLPKESPFWAYENVILTPHSSSVSSQYHERVAELVRTNLDRIRAGEDLTNRVV